MQRSSEMLTTHYGGSLMHADVSPSGQTTDARPDWAGGDTADSSITIAAYVERRFIPEHVMRKTIAGRVHYQALLKHILSPELVAAIFSRHGLESKNKLRAIPGWAYLDHTKLCDVNADHVRELIECASARGYSPQTIKHIKNVVGAIISHAQHDGTFNGNNPASKVTLQRPIHRAPRNITFQQAKAIVGLLDGAEREIALLSLTTGMSAFEICKLQWKHINLSAVPIMCEGEIIPPRCIMVRREFTPTDLGLPTTPRSKTVEIPDALFHRLLRTKRIQQHTRPEASALGLRDTAAGPEIAVGRARLLRVGRELGIPWLSWQVLKRGHQALLAEMRNQLSCSLVASAG